MTRSIQTTGLRRPILRFWLPSCSFIFVLLVGLAELNAASDHSIKDGTELVSIVELIARPEAYYNKLVLTHGVLVLGLEESRLYLSEADARLAIFENGIEIRFGNDGFRREHAVKLNTQYVEVLATFVRNDKREYIVVGAGYFDSVKEVLPKRDWARRSDVWSDLVGDNHVESSR